IPRCTKPRRPISLSPRRIFDRPVLKALRAGPKRTVLRGGIADGDDDVELLIEKFVRRFRLRIANVDPDLRERADRERMHPTRRPRSRRHHIHHISMKRPHQPLGHLTPRGVSGAKEENAFLRGHPTIKPQTWFKSLAPN